MSFKEKSPLVVALYLPQYYETEYNNKWWEKGYTEWVACKRAKPLYPFDIRLISDAGQVDDLILIVRFQKGNL